MKKVLFFVMLLAASYYVKAQTITIQNNSACTVNFNFGASDAGTCNQIYRSVFTSIAAGAPSVTYSCSSAGIWNTAPSCSSGFDFSFFQPLDGPPGTPGCGTAGAVIGDAACSYPASQSMTVTPGCSSCSSGTVHYSWSVSGGNVTVTIN